MFKNIDVTEVIDNLIEQGYSIIPNAVSGILLKQMTEEVDEILENTVDDESYKFGKAVRTGRIENQNSAIKAVFNNYVLEDITQNYLFDKTSVDFGHDVFITHDYRNNLGKHSNGIFHFDKINCLKFMLYLSNINSKEDGAFSVIPHSHIGSEEKRIQEWTKAETYDEIYNQPNINEKDIVPILGSAGTMIVFDTNTIHAGGNVANGHERKIIRMHCWHSDSVLKQGLV